VKITFVNGELNTANSSHSRVVFVNGQLVTNLGATTVVETTPAADPPTGYTLTKNLYVSAGNQAAAPFFNFYTDAGGTSELSPDRTLYLDTRYIFSRVSDATSHPFYVSDVGYESASTSDIYLAGDGGRAAGISGSQTLTLIFDGLTVTGTLYYYCTAHSNMIGQFNLVAETPEDAGLTGLEKLSQDLLGQVNVPLLLGTLDELEIISLT
jgi:hypothetical protein